MLVQCINGFVLESDCNGSWRRYIRMFKVGDDEFPMELVRSSIRVDTRYLHIGHKQYKWSVIDQTPAQVQTLVRDCFCCGATDTEVQYFENVSVGTSQLVLNEQALEILSVMRNGVGQMEADTGWESSDNLTIDLGYDVGQYSGDEESFIVIYKKAV